MNLLKNQSKLSIPITQYLFHVSLQLVFLQLIIIKLAFIYYYKSVHLTKFKEICKNIHQVLV